MNADESDMRLPLTLARINYFRPLSEFINGSSHVRSVRQFHCCVRLRVYWRTQALTLLDPVRPYPEVRDPRANAINEEIQAQGYKKDGEDENDP